MADVSYSIQVAASAHGCRQIPRNGILPPPPGGRSHDWLGCDLLSKKLLGLRILGVPLGELLGCQKVK